MCLTTRPVERGGGYMRGLLSAICKLLLFALDIGDPIQKINLWIPSNKGLKLKHFYFFIFYT